MRGVVTDDRGGPRMAKKRKEGATLGTIWRAPDGLWEKVALVLDELDPPSVNGRPQMDSGPRWT